MRKTTLIGLLLLAFCAVCRYWSPAADFYAERLYPWISGALSWLGSLPRFSLEEFVVLGFVVTFVDQIVKAVKHREKFTSWLGNSLVTLMWLLVWFYMGWGNNYYRTGLYERSGIRRTTYDESAFQGFLERYTNELALSAAEAGDYGREMLEAEVKAFYTKEVTGWGYAPLRRWQHVKRPVWNRLFSAVSVQGYMGPFFSESQVNRDVSEAEYPYVVAHEMAHLAGVTSEAEASFWGFEYCRGSANAAVRYSGYLALLPYVLQQANYLLSEEDYAALIDRIPEKAREDYTADRENWKRLRIGWIDRIQSWMQDGMLKGNGVSEGRRDYFGVVSMIMTMDAAREKVEI